MVDRYDKGMTMHPVPSGGPEVIGPGDIGHSWTRDKPGAKVHASNSNMPTCQHGKAGASKETGRVAPYSRSCIATAMN